MPLPSPLLKERGLRGEAKNTQMKPLLLLSTLALPIGIFAQGNFHANPPAQQAQNINYYDQLDNNNSLGNASNKINDDAIQTNIAVQQQANPPAQQGSSLGNIFGSVENDNQQAKKPYCKDCEEVKKAIAAAHSSSGSHHRKAGGLKKWSKKFSYNTRVKMKKIFAHKYRPKTSYEVCFLWH